MARVVAFILLMFMCRTLKVSGDVCPDNEKVVYMCEANFNQGANMYLDSSRSLGYDGSCTCFIQAVNEPITIQLTAEHVPTQCRDLLDFTGLSFMLLCDEKGPPPVTQIIPTGTQSYITLNRNNKESRADFCVHLQQTNPEGEGQISLTCLKRSKNDILVKNATEAPEEVTTVKEVRVTTERGATPRPTIQPTSNLPVANVTDGDGVTQASANTSTQDITVQPGGTTVKEVTTQRATTPRSADNHTSTQQTTNRTSSLPTTGSTNVTTQTDRNNTTSNPEITTAIVPTNNSENETDTSTTPAGNVTDGGDITQSSANTTTEGTSAQHEDTTGKNDAQVETKGDASNIQSFIVVGLLGGTIMLLVLLGLFVYFRDKRRAKIPAEAKTEDKEEEQRV